MKKKGYPYKQLKNGDFIYCTSHYYFTCCDCGKRHIHCIDRVTKVGKNGNPSLKTNDKLLALRIYDDKTIDQLNRKLKKWEKE